MMLVLILNGNFIKTLKLLKIKIIFIFLYFYLIVISMLVVDTWGTVTYKETVIRKAHSKGITQEFHYSALAFIFGAGVHFVHKELKTMEIIYRE